MVFEYVKHGDLYNYLLVHGRVDEFTAKRWLCDLLLALHACHVRGIVHLDVKPSNLLIDSNYRLKLADFGSSHFQGPNEELDELCGTLPYTAPEVFGDGSYNGMLADVWSVGVIAYEMLSGVLPFAQTHMRAVVDTASEGIPYLKEFSEDCHDLLKSILAVNPRERPSIEEIFGHRYLSEPKIRPASCFDVFNRMC